MNSLAGFVNNTLTGELVVLKSDVTTDYLLKSNEEIYNIYFNEINDNLKTGDIITVSPENINTASINNNNIYINNYSLIQKNNLTDIESFSSITFLVNFCNITNYLKTNDVYNIWFNASPSLEEYYRTCSFGKMQFIPENNIVYPETITMPCNGIYNNVKYNWNNSCSTSEIYATMDYIKKYVENKKFNIKKYKRTIVILPKALNCPWVGLANMGCSSLYCDVWLDSSFMVSRFYKTVSVFHELGHTMGLSHSITTSDGYGDYSCAMGYINYDRCYGASQSSNLHWNEPILDISNMTKNRTLTISIPGFITTQKNYVKYNNYYFSYKIPKYFESNIDPHFANTLLIQQMNHSFDVSLLVNRTKTTYEIDNLNIRVNALNNDSINLSFCYFCKGFPTSPRPPPKNSTSLFIYYLNKNVSIEYVNYTLCNDLEYAIEQGVLVKSSFNCNYVSSNTVKGLYYQATFDSNIVKLKRYMKNNLDKFTSDANLVCGSVITLGPNIPGRMFIWNHRVSLNTCKKI